MSIDIYMKQVSKHRVLSTDEQLDLARRACNGDMKSGQKLILHNLRFAVKLAHQYKRYGYAFEDLVQEANIGLMLALRRFNPELGIKFISYACWWVKARLNGHCISHLSLVKFGTTQAQRALYPKVSAVVQRLRHEHPRDSDAEIFARAADQLGHPPELVYDVYVRVTERDQSLNAPVGDGSRTQFQDLLPSTNGTPEDQLLTAERDEVVRVSLYQVCRNQRELDLVQDRLLSDEPVTYEVLGLRHSISRERVRQVEQGLKQRVKPKLRSVG